MEVEVEIMEVQEEMAF